MMEVILRIQEVDRDRQRQRYVPRLEIGRHVVMAGTAYSRKADALRGGERLIRRLWHQTAVTVIAPCPRRRGLLAFGMINRAGGRC